MGHPPQTETRQLLDAGLVACTIQAQPGAPPQWYPDADDRLCPACGTRVPRWQGNALSPAAQAHWRAHLDAGRRLVAATEHVRLLVMSDAFAGRFDLTQVGSFGDLHEYVDANEYLISAGEALGFRPLANLDLCNAVADATSLWLGGASGKHAAGALVHGSVETFDTGCRCGPCVAAGPASLPVLSWTGEAGDSPPPVHGSVEGFDAGCCCEPCRTAGREHSEGS